MFENQNKKSNFALYYKHDRMIVTPEQQPKWNAIIIDTLRFFTVFCEKHHLTYYCCGGTAIGAVRHHGLIPWDDDIDVFMPRPEYDRFIELALAEQWEDYELVTPYNKENYPLFFAKLCNRHTTLIEEADTPCVYGLFIDIFPLDGAPDDIKDAQMMEARFRKTRNQLEAISTHNTFAEYIRLLLQPKEWGRFFRKTIAFFSRDTYRRRLLRQLKALSYQYDYKTSTNVINYCGAYGVKELFPKEWVKDRVPFSFEEITVYLPSDYDNYLHHIYGDYMQLPPEEKRVGHHLKAYYNLEERIPDKEAIKTARSKT